MEIESSLHPAADNQRSKLEFSSKRSHLCFDVFLCIYGSMATLEMRTISQLFRRDLKISFDQGRGHFSVAYSAAYSASIAEVLLLFIGPQNKRLGAILIVPNKVVYSSDHI